MTLIDPGSCAEVRKAVRYARRLFLVRGISAAITVVASVLLVPGPLSGAFVLTVIGLAAIFLSAVYAHPPFEDMFPDAKFIEVTEDDAFGTGGAVRRMVRRLSESAGIPIPQVFVISGGTAPVAFSRSIGRPGMVVINGLFAARFPEYVSAVAAHEVAHVALRHSRTTRVARVVDGISVWIGLAAGICALIGLVGALVMGPSWLGYAGHCAELLFLAIVAVKLPRRDLPQLRHLHEFAADEYGARLHGDPMEFAAALWNVTLITGDTDIGSSNDSHPSIFDRIKRLLAAQEDAKNRADR